VRDLTGTLIAAAAAIVAGWFALALVRRYVERGRVNRALVYWAVALGMFCLASAGLAMGEAVGWSGAWFRLYYLFGGVLTVPWLALGTVQISSRDRFTLRALGITGLVVGVLFAVPMMRADDPILYGLGAALGIIWGLLLLTSAEGANAGSLAIIGTFTAVGAFVVLNAQISGPIPVGELPEAADLLLPGVRAFAVGGNAVGSLIVIVGGITAATRLRAVGAPHLVTGNLLIAFGVLIAASGGLFAFVGDTEGHAIAFAIGVTVMYAGFTRTTRLAVPPVEAPSERSTPLVEVYTREDCGLCERAERLAEEEAAEADVRLIDIDADPDLQRRYNVRVPVVVVDGEEVAEGRIESGTIAAAVEHARERT
jgi:glutaredoxin